MKYVSGRDGLQVDGETRNFGDPVPEAANWPNVKVWLDGRFILEVPDDWEAPKPPAPEPAPPAAGGYMETPWPNGAGPNPGIDDVSHVESTGPSQKEAENTSAGSTAPGTVTSGGAGEWGNSPEAIEAAKTAQNASEGHALESADVTGDADPNHGAGTAQEVKADADANGGQGEAPVAPECAAAPEAAGSVLATVTAPVKAPAAGRSKKPTTK